MLVLALAFAPAAKSQTYVPGQTAASVGLQRQQQSLSQQQTLQLQRNLNALSMQPGDPALQAQLQASQAQLRQIQQDDLQAQMQQQQTQRQILQQSLAPAR